MVNIRQAFRPSPPPPDATPFRCLVYVTGGPEDARLMEIVRQVASQPNTHITLAYVVEVQQSIPLDAELPAEVVRGEEVLQQAGMIATRCVGGRSDRVSTELLQARSAGAAIVDQAMDEHADAIMLACSVHRKFGRPTVGETVEYTLLNATCEVHVIRMAVQDERIGGYGAR